MSLHVALRAFRAAVALSCVAALAIAPAAASASTPQTAKAKQAAIAKKKAAQAVARRNTAAGLGNAYGLVASTQLAAMKTAMNGAPAFYAGMTTGCATTTPMLTTQPGQVMAGNFRDGDGNCYVWLNLAHSDLMTGSEICKVSLHEMGHLNGLQHSTDPANVMYSPFVADSMPPLCQPETLPAAASAKASAASATICPPGATNQDYCQATPRKRSASAHARSVRSLASLTSLSLSL